jgi:metallo-beta-lactamase family protein
MNTDTPWLPADIDETFAPKQHFDIELDDETPMAVTPRGGGREVGRSCYQLDTQSGTYLIDCGLSQGGDEKFPDLRGLSPDDIDSVFLTHAHIDHSGGLPVLENRGLLDGDARIFATEPTIQIAQTLLEDSLKLHLRETADGDAEQQFTEADVESIFRRFSAIEYTTGADTSPLSVRNLVPDTESVEPLSLSVGNAAHLLGSAWFAFESHGRRVVFSGDIGGRAKQLPDVDVPPQADHLFIESTYGATHSHRSMSDAGTELFNLLADAIRNGEPVLIPTFATGRAQTLLLMFNDRGHALPGEIRQDYQLGACHRKRHMQSSRVRKVCPTQPRPCRT